MRSTNGAAEPSTSVPGVFRHANPRRQGDAGLGIAIAWFTAHAYLVSLPLTDSQPYDLVVDDGQSLSRVWVRTTTITGPPPGRHYLLNLRTISGVGRGRGMVKVRLFDPGTVDLLFVACGDGSLFLIPAGEVQASSQIQLGPRRWAERRVDWTATWVVPGTDSHVQPSR